jgi:hypothetical protein
VLPLQTTLWNRLLSTLPKSGYTVCGLRVPPVVLLFRTLCPASPSLQRVAWAVLPRLPDRYESSVPVIGTMFRYDCRTSVSGSFDFLFPSLIPCCFPCS